MISVNIQCGDCGNTISFASDCDSIETEEVQSHVDATYKVPCGHCKAWDWEVVDARFIGASRGL